MQAADLKDINSILKLYQNKKLTSLIPLLPCLSIRGKPYTLEEHFTMEPLFKTVIPRKSVWKCGRQVSKSTSVASGSIIQSVAMAYFRTLTVHPRFTQTKQFSSNVVQALIDSSPIKSLMMDPKCENSIQQRSFKNHSALYFSFAFLDAERCRGISCDKTNFDEVQDLDSSFIPVIQETMSASKFKISQYTGTPKSFDNTIEGLWSNSSQAEWVTRCDRCNYHNVATVSQDLLKMIGKTTVVCAKCERPINPAAGFFEHAVPTRIGLFEGYHAPQIIFPMHYAAKLDWDNILYKQEHYGKTEFYNEVLGESNDQGHKLVSLTDLKAAAVLTHNNELHAALAIRGKYAEVVMGTDWGGYGVTGDSFTVISIVGRSPGTDILEVLYLERLPVGMDDTDQAKRVKELLGLFHCSLIAHDYGGQGSVRETLLLHAKIPKTSIIPMLYIRTRAGAIMQHTPPSEHNPRSYYSIDKARSLSIICAYVKKQKIKFPKYDSCVGIISDFLALIAESSESKHGAENYFIGKASKLSDDAVHATNYACLALWYRSGEFPQLTESPNIDPEEANPPDKW